MATDRHRLGVAVAATVATDRVTQSLLFEVSALDPIAFAIAAADDDDGRHAGALYPGHAAPRGSIPRPPYGRIVAAQGTFAHSYVR